MKGIELSRRFHHEWIEPLIDHNYPALNYSAALIGPGSEVLGYDTELSQDHDWGPRVQLFLQETDGKLSDELRALVTGRLPQTYCGFPVDAQTTVVTTLEQYIWNCLAYDLKEPLDAVDWLTFPSQTLLELTKGEVFRDDRGQLAELRDRLHYYPQDVWFYLLASAWQRIGQEEHLMLRAGHAGDELGSAVIASRLVRDVMNLCFLMERQYAPYPKWFGTAFRELKCAELLEKDLWQVQTATAWKAREQALNKVYGHLARKHNELGLTEPVKDEASSFFTRPFLVMNGEDIGGRLERQIQNPTLRWLFAHRLIGNIDQITDNTDFRMLNTWKDEAENAARQTLKKLYLFGARVKDETDSLK
ncbi:DUF4037 domain-containing protein [Paenibacillus montanisoli]|uniref:DUF4037 domain-containing protein n=1 Tax=Paenibacillus montanisoli TaxID=2081970 RepID=A0A328U6X0_9BACL|nr:DUF4037 domain-containing protein [Paenibacillus montanisoli]RAP77513.1 hypothetical protein DL346_03260 [Paenibacillus montanisoli]